MEIEFVYQPNQAWLIFFILLLYVATEEITLSHTIIFYKALITLSATKEHKTPAIKKCVCL